MNTNTQKMNQYLVNQIKTATPEQILLMLYDGAIRFTKQAMTGIKEKNERARIHGISKAYAIVSEFSNSLDREIGGKIAEDLDALYDFIMRELSTANINKDIKKLQAVEMLLIDLRGTWAEAIELHKKDNTSEYGAKYANDDYRSISA